MTKALMALLVSLALCLPLCGQATTYDQATIDQKSTLETAFRDPRPPLQKITFHFIDETVVNGLKAKRYSLSVKGLGRGRSYGLMTWDLASSGPVLSLVAVRLNDNDVVTCGDEANPCPGAPNGSGVVLTLTAMQGQPRRYMLIGADRKPVAMGEVVPFPVEGKDRRCTVEAVALTPNSEAMLIVGRGFAPGEKLQLTSSSRGEVVKGAGNATAAGGYRTVILPYVRGFDEGVTQVTLKGAACSPQLKFRWGPYGEVVSETP